MISLLKIKGFLKTIKKINNPYKKDANQLLFENLLPYNAPLVSKMEFGLKNEIM